MNLIKLSISSKKKLFKEKIDHFKLVLPNCETN